jgi:RNA polymerase sigma-54 factor
LPVTRKIPESLLSKITLSRFLELPPRSFQKFVHELENSTAFTALQSTFVVAALPDTSAPHQLNNEASRPVTALGRLSRENGELRLIYQCPCFTRQYRLENDAGQPLAPPATTADLQRRKLFQQLRLINTRNQLSNALINAAISAQKKYLLSEDVLDLLEYSQLNAARDILQQLSAPASIADPSRISRLARHLCMLSAEGRVISLSRLFVNSRQRSQYLIDSLVKAEALSLFQGYRGTPLTDDDLAVILNNVHHLPISRRSVTNTRHSLAIPDHRERHKHMRYVAATSGFSCLLPLRLELLDGAIPAKSGVYEIRLREAENHKGPSSLIAATNKILYIGSSLNLKKRLREHLTGNSNNQELYKILSTKNTEVRFKLFEAPRQTERDLYQTFLQTFGSSPSCNRISP